MDVAGKVSKVADRLAFPHSEKLRMRRTSTTVVLVLGLLLALSAGCCGEKQYTRELVIVDHRGDEMGRGYSNQIEVDTSQLGEGVVESTKEQNATWWCYQPKTVIHISPKVPIKVLIVPASPPMQSSTSTTRPAQ
jgi:hypothetical protein